MRARAHVIATSVDGLGAEKNQPRLPDDGRRGFRMRACLRLYFLRVASLLAHRIEAVRSATGRRQIKTRETEKYGRGAAIEQRQEYRRVSLLSCRPGTKAEGTSASHFARENKSRTPRSTL